MIAERAIALTASDGVTLEARLAEVPGSRGGVVVCHPHPLYGGDMENPVVVRAAEVCADLGLSALRFNFRGVGASTGSHGEGVAERQDVEAALDYLKAASGGGVALIGYSFGSLVAAHVAAMRPEVAGLCLVGPPLSRSAVPLPAALAEFERPWTVAVGTRDEYCSPAAVDQLQRAFPHARVTLIEGANHFFLGKLFPLGERVADWARAVMARWGEAPR